LTSFSEKKILYRKSVFPTSHVCGCKFSLPFSTPCIVAEPPRKPENVGKSGKSWKFRKKVEKSGKS